MTVNNSFTLEKLCIIMTQIHYKHSKSSEKNKTNHM